MRQRSRGTLGFSQLLPPTLPLGDVQTLGDTVAAFHAIAITFSAYNLFHTTFQEISLPRFVINLARIINEKHITQTLTRVVFEGKSRRGCKQL